MPHIIILEGIDDMAGDDPVGGCFQSLRGYMETVEAIESIKPLSRTIAQRAVMEQADVIAGKFETSGFTANAVCTDTATLGTLIDAL